MALPRINRTDKLDQTNIYRDFSTSMGMNPLTNDVIANIDVKSVKESMKNILLTDRGSRVFNPSFGGNIKSLLFENKYSPALFKLVEEEVRRTINTYEPRVTLESVECVGTMDDNILHILINFYIINSEQLQSTTVVMEKIR